MVTEESRSLKERGGRKLKQREKWAEEQRGGQP
jgi:hypothetical protein